MLRILNHQYLPLLSIGDTHTPTQKKNETKRIKVHVKKKSH